MRKGRFDNFRFLHERFCFLVDNSGFVSERFRILYDFFALFNVTNCTTTPQNGSYDTQTELVPNQNELCVVENRLVNLQIELQKASL